MISPAVVVLLVVLVLCGECSDGHHYYVTAENGSDCPPFVPCHSLSHYVQDRDTYFTSDTVIEFLPGLHKLNHSGHVLIELVENLTIIGSSSFKNNQLDYRYSDSVILCTSLSGFTFAFVRDLGIINITFSNCGAILPLPLGIIFTSYIALGVIETTSLLLDGVTIEKSHGIGLLAMNIWSSSLITSCTFIGSNENIWNRQDCLNSTDGWQWTCFGGNVRLHYIDIPIMGSSNDAVQFEIKDSIFARGVAGIREQHATPYAAGLEIVLGVMLHDTSIIVNNSLFTNNTGSKGANIGIQFVMHDANVKINVRIDRCRIQYGLYWSQPSHDTARAAGIVSFIVFANEHLDNSVPLHISNSNFTQNVGGALELTIMARKTVVYNSKGYDIIIENCKVISNLALSFSAAMMFSLIYQKPPILETVLNVGITIKESEFHQNVERHESIGILTFYQLPKLTIVNSTFINNFGSPAIYLYRSKLYLQGEVLFQNNTSSTDGGALYLHDNSLLYFHPDTKIAFIGNSARHRGGAIYVESLTEIGIPYCFFQLEEVHNYAGANVQLTFEGNHAIIAGDAIYGGRVDSCFIYSLPPITVLSAAAIDRGVSIPSIKVFNTLFNFTKSTPSLSLISSNPIGIRFCNSTSINYAPSQTLLKQVYPGQLFEVEAVAIGQYNGTTPAVVSAIVDTGNTTKVLETVQVAQETHKKCTNLQYRILSSKSYEVIHLQPAGVSRKFFDYYANIIMNITLLDCAPGFELQRSFNMTWCNCHSLLNQFNITCDINNQTITKKDRAWISHNPTSGLLLHAHCPFDYCSVGVVTFKLEDPDKQCAFSRVGTLCGACQEGFSLALGTSRCLKCSNVRLTLLLPFAVAGLALVFVLLTLNFTVSTGTVNGLIFYVNVVRANQAVFFPPGDRSVFSVFIAWLNLDLGIETCFYGGLDGYAKTWLQLVFPVYIWAMVVVIVVLSRRYVLAAKLCGSHSVQVLATLFLLSYAKVLRTIITMFSFTIVNLENDNASKMIVWLYDGNVSYTGVKHDFLLLTALGLSIFYILPFTMLVLLAPCLQAHSNKSLLRWVHRLKPFLDAYQGPYEDKFRCWTGVLLVVRNILFLAFALNGPSNPMVNLLVIITVVISLLGCMWLAGRVYKVYNLNLLEALFIVKLGIFSAWTSFIHQNTPNPVESQMIAAYVTTSTTILLFLMIVVYHVYCWLQTLEVARNVISKFHRSPQEHSEEVQNDDQSVSDCGVAVHAPTVTYIDMRDLREPLLSGDGHEP